MKSLKLAGSVLAFAISLSTFSCGQEKTTEGSGSTSQTTPNDSSATPSKSAIGTNDDNQKDSLGYPSNQSNLNADSTSKKHDN